MFPFRAENFEPYLSQVLKIRWEDDLGKKNPLADKEYRYFGQLFCAFVDLPCSMWPTTQYCLWQRNMIKRVCVPRKYAFVSSCWKWPKCSPVLIFSSNLELKF